MEFEGFQLDIPNVSYVSKFNVEMHSLIIN